MTGREPSGEHITVKNGEEKESKEQRFADLAILADVYILIKTEVDKLASVKDGAEVERRLPAIKSEAETKMANFLHPEEKSIYLEILNEWFELLIKKNRAVAALNGNEVNVIKSLSHNFTAKINPKQARVLKRSAFEVVVGINHQELINLRLKQGEGKIEVAIDVGGNRSFHIPGTPFIVVRLENGHKNGKETKEYIRHEEIHNRTEGLVDNRLPSVTLKTILQELGGQLGNFRGVSGKRLREELDKNNLLNELQGELLVAILTEKEKAKNPFATVEDEVRQARHLIVEYIKSASHRPDIAQTLKKYYEEFSTGFTQIVVNIREAYKIAGETDNKERAEAELEALLVALDPVQYKEIADYLKYKYKK